MGELRLFRKRASRTWNHQVTGGEVAVSLTPFWAGFRALRDHWVEKGMSNQRRIPRGTTPPYHRIIFDSEHVEQAPAGMGDFRLFRKRAGRTRNHQVTGGEVAVSLTPFWAGFRALRDHWVAESLWNQRRIPRGTTPPYHRAIFYSEQVEQAPSRQGITILEPAGLCANTGWRKACRASAAYLGGLLLFTTGLLSEHVEQAPSSIKMY